MTALTTFKKGDLVMPMPDTGAGGIVVRVARDQSWVDVHWSQGDEDWRKRMKPDKIEWIGEV